MFIIFGGMLGNWVYLSILGFIAVLLFKDVLTQRKTVIEVKKDRLEVRAGTQIKQVIYYKDLQFITRTRRHKKWVVMGHDRNIFYIRPSIVRYEAMLEDVLRYNKSNKKVFIHETIESGKAQL